MQTLYSFTAFTALLFIAVPSVTGFPLGDLLNKTVIYFPDPAEAGKVIPAYLGRGIEDFLVWPPNVSDVGFLLLTNKNQEEADELLFEDLDSVMDSHFIPNAPLKVLAHGFGANPTHSFPRRLAEAYVQRGEDMNVIMIDWSRLAMEPWYNIAAPSTRYVGEHIGAFIQFLVGEGLVRLEDVHLIGYSLGAHVVGNAGRYLGGRVGRVTGLDPALPFFDITKDEYRIDPTDGVFVDVIHTSGAYLTDHGLAFQKPRGDADFYPNNGHDQPGCDAEVFGGCSHARAPAYFLESIRNPAAFPACSCPTWFMFLASKCDCTNPVLMGDPVNKTAKGRYYLLTNSDDTEYYGLGINGLTNAIIPDSGSGAHIISSIASLPPLLIVAVFFFP